MRRTAALIATVLFGLASTPAAEDLIVIAFNVESGGAYPDVIAEAIDDIAGDRTTARHRVSGEHVARATRSLFSVITLIENRVDIDRFSKMVSCI